MIYLVHNLYHSDSFGIFRTLIRGKDVTQNEQARGPLAGLRIVEFDSLGPGPFAGMLLADMGADVLRISRDPASNPLGFDTITRRNRRILRLDLKDGAARETARTLCARADVLIEGYRPGVMERLSLGPAPLLEANPRLVYARMTGWGQAGPLAQRAGHDLNYISLTGALAAIGTAESGPVPPLNLVGDYGGGALYLVTGILAALHERARSGKGQVIDAAMCDGAVSLMTVFHGMAAEGAWRQERAANLLDGGAPWYGVYECADGGHVAVGAIEPQFWRELCVRIGIEDLADADRDAPECRERIRAELARVFRSRSRDAWAAMLENSDACVTPVLTLSEAQDHPHLAARETFATVEGMSQPAPAPRFSRTPSPSPRSAVHVSVEEAVDFWRD